MTFVTGSAPDEYFVLMRGMYFGEQERPQSAAVVATANSHPPFTPRALTADDVRRGTGTISRNPPPAGLASFLVSP